MRSVRPGTPADEPLLCRLRDEALAQSQPGLETIDRPVAQRPSLQRRTTLPRRLFDRQDRRVLVVEDEATPVGWALVYLDDEPLAVAFTDTTVEASSVRSVLIDEIESVGDGLTETTIPLFVF